MAVSKIWPVRVRLKTVIDYASNPDKTFNPEYTKEQYQSLRDVLEYAENEEKTEKEFFVDGINCNPSTARDQFVTVKEQFGKTDGIQAYHGYLSFSETDLTPDTAQKIGVEFAEQVWGKRFQVVVATHLNTKHLHCHFVINSVSFIDGKRLANEEKAWFRFRHIADEICLNHGLHCIEEPERNLEPDYIRQQTRNGKPTRQNLLKEAIDEAVSSSTSWVQFEYAMKEMGYTISRNPRRKYMTVLPKGAQKPIRLYRLGEEYSEERIAGRLKANQGRVIFKTFKRQDHHRQYRLQTRGHKIRKIGGLYGLYLYYCYKLGYLPKYRRPSSRRIHYLLRDDLIKLDRITEQVRFMGSKGIRTSEDLLEYKNSVKERINTLAEERKHLRNEIRRAGTTDSRVSDIKERISELSNSLKELRKDLRLCEDIEERSGRMWDKLEKVLSDEEKINRKECRNHEYGR